MRKRIVNVAFLMFLPCPFTLGAPEINNSFADAGTYLATDGQDLQFAPDDLRVSTAALAAQFEAACGDTFCAGDYANLQPLEWTCTVRTSDGALGQCLWVFAGSAARIDPASGTLTSVADTFSCKVPITGSIQDLVAFLGLAKEPGDSGYEGLTRTKLPGSGHTLSEVLIGCLGG